MKLGIKREAPAPAYVPCGLLQPRLSDRKRGFGAVALTEYWRSCANSELDFCNMRLSHAKLHHKECAELLQNFRNNMGAGSPAAAKTLARYQQDADEAWAEVNYAEALLHCEQEAA